jgi:hypothetical protein
MKIRTQKYISDKKYFVEIRNEDFSEEDNKLIQKFGEPEINVGGLYGATTGPTSTWIAPDKFVKIKKGFQPYIAYFDSRSFADASDRANSLIATLIDRIQEAVAALRAQQDSYTSETVTNV